jgi:hypothetical protein
MSIYTGIYIASGSQWWPDADRNQWPGVAAMKSYETVAGKDVNTKAKESTSLGVVT